MSKKIRKFVLTFLKMDTLTNSLDLQKVAIMSVDEKLLLIRNYDLWAHISDEEYEELNIIHNFIEAEKGDYLYFEAHLHNRIYFLKEGYIKIGHIDTAGNEIVKEILQKGELFGQITLERNNMMGEFALAHKSNVSLCSFTIEDFRTLLKKKPELAFKYTQQVGTKLKRVESRLLNLLSKDIRSRLINFFANLVLTQVKSPLPTEIRIPNFFTHEDIAQLVGSTRQTVTTMLTQLSQEEILHFSRKEIWVPDVKKLQNMMTVG